MLSYATFYMKHFIKEMFQDLPVAINEVKTLFSLKDSIGMKCIKGVTLLLIVLLFLPLYVFYFFLLLGAYIVIVIKRLCRKEISKNIPLYLDDASIQNLICTVLNQHSTELDIVKPESVYAILPTNHPCVQQINGFRYYTFIVRFNNTGSADFNVFYDMLSTYIFQLLQEFYCFCTLTYKDEPVLKVFEVSKNPSHPGFVSIKILIIDNEEKYQYIKHLANCSWKKNQPADFSSLTDKEF